MMYCYPSACICCMALVAYCVLHIMTSSPGFLVCPDPCLYLHVISRINAGGITSLINGLPVPSALPMIDRIEYAVQGGSFNST
ncbi:hypothetical protein F5Y02DRAFT_199675 [Annulohypoxylon stygium]|nr:hypothetical protein F5Y02DRAFT_199675 [Annulohypoxylon stygium]